MVKKEKGPHNLMVKLRYPNQPMNLDVIVRRLLSNYTLGARGSCKETAIDRCFLQGDVVIFQSSLDLIVIDYWLQSSERILAWR